MSITLSNGTTTLTLPPDLAWINEDSWAPVVQETGYSVGGALIIETATKLAGRQITLQSQQNVAWVSRADVLQLRDWAAVAGQVFTLTIPDRALTLSVVFDHQNTALEAEMVIFYGDIIASDRYTVTMRFLEI